ncbi:MAG: hypothetical protein ACKVZJ_03615 [Phycisphaerales bacterium]
MMRRTDSDRAPLVPPQAASSARRGYVFLIVLVVMVIGMIMVMVAIERAGAQASIAQERARDYQRHHEMLGMRDLLVEWLQRPGRREELFAAAKTGATFYDAALPGELIVSARATDAQGAVLLPHAGVSDPQLVFALNDLVARLPPDRPDLVRSSGPPQISLGGAPDEVLRALSDGDGDLFEILRAMQAEQSMDAARFSTSLGAVGMSDKSAELTRVLTFTPNYFRLKIRVDDGREVRRYSMLADLTGNMMPIFRSMRFEPAGPGNDDQEWVGLDNSGGATGGRDGGSRRSTR